MATQPLHVHLLPTLIPSRGLAGGTAVIIDILRASSTIITALHQGAARVVPCATPEEAMHVRSTSAPGTVLLGGERGGVRIEGFDFGNSPEEYPRQSVEGRVIAFTTTNGTRALFAASAAQKILVGAFLNQLAVVERLERDHKPTHLICAGTNGIITGEDVLFAGAVVSDLLFRFDQGVNSSSFWSLNDSAVIALNNWRMGISEAAGSAISPLESLLRLTEGGRNLTDLGYDSDITLCSQLDCCVNVPEYDRTENHLY
jgi:2-phosphosulfolactate phosphatase